MRKNTIEQFDSQWVPEPFSGCHLWHGAATRGKSGLYGQLRWYGKKIGAHRQAWILAHGGIPSGMLVLHHCDTPLCVNPDHLFLGTQSENMLDASRKGRMAIGTMHHNAKLTSEQVIEIRNSPDSCQNLSLRFNVTIAVIRTVKKRQAWKHVP